MRLNAVSYLPSRARSKLIFSSTSSIESVGNEATTSALRARQSKVLTWSASMTPRNLEARRYDNLEGISFDLAGDRAQQSETDLSIVGSRRENKSRPPSGLLASGLRIEVDPYSVAALRYSLRPHHASRPVDGPVSTSPCLLSAVTPSRRTSKLTAGRLTG